MLGRTDIRGGHRDRDKHLRLVTRRRLQTRVGDRPDRFRLRLLHDLNERRRARRAAEVAAAEAGLPISRLRHFAESHHDIHMERPAELAQWMLEALDEDFFA